MEKGLAPEQSPFDFEAHRRAAVDEFAKKRPAYVDFAEVVKRILGETIRHGGLKIHSVEARAKDLESFGDKAMRPSATNPGRPMYETPVEQVEDLAGARVITFFPSTIEEVDKGIREEFDVVERRDLGASLLEEERFGYQSVHYIVKLATKRAILPEYRRFVGLLAEVQVRTVLQHAWAEIEHDIQYKSTATIPKAIRRRFMALAGLLEIADREFEAIQQTDRSFREAARASVKQGELSQVEITPDALQVFLDQRLGPDARVSEYSYEWTARLLTKLGFTNFAQVQECIKAYDDGQLSQILAGWRQGQTTRFEFLLLAGMGEGFLHGHLWEQEPWFVERSKANLQKLQQRGIKPGSYRPGLQGVLRD